MERYKEFRKKMLRQMAVSIVTMAAIPASQPHKAINEMAWTQPGAVSNTISADLLRGHGSTDCDNEPGHAG